MKAPNGWFIGLVFVVSASAEPLLEGQVRLSSGQPVADAQVQLFDLTNLRQGAIARAMTDGTGYFALPLAALTGGALPERFALGPNYPNPFNPSTIIPYQLAASSQVRLEVFNLLGQRIATLVDGERAAGFHTATWHATDGAGRAVGAGVYIYRMTVGVESQTGRMVLIDGQAGLPAAGAASVMPDVSGGGGSDRQDAQVYGLIVSGSGLAPYVDSAFRVEAGMAPVELVVSEGPHSAGKATDDDCAFCDFFGGLGDQQEEEEEETTASDGGPDLIVQSPSASALTLTPGQTFTLNVTVHNQGDQQAAATTLHYYRSNNSTITASDTEVGTDEVGALDASATSTQSIELTAPTGGAPGVYYGACVASVSGESNTGNNCSSAVRITVSGQVATEEEEDETPEEEGGDALTIPDANLRAAIAAALGKARGAPITKREMTRLKVLRAQNKGIRDLEGLQFATNLTSLSLGRAKSGYNYYISPGITAYAEYQPADEVNEISDVSVLSSLTKLTYLDLHRNKISDVAPLAANTGLGSGDQIDVTGNPLNSASINTHIPALQDKGVDVFFDEVVVTAHGDPQIYNDNVFVLPVTEDLVTDQLPMRDYAARFYEYFDDAFDFLMIWSNLYSSEDMVRGYAGVYYSVMNNVQGIGLSIFSDSRWGSAGELQGVIHIPDFWGHGVLKHEVMHQWANFVIPTSHGPHWGFSSANGVLGGFDIADLVDLGGGRYSASWFFPTGGKTYGPIELYLAGFIPPEDVPDLLIAEDGEWLRDDEGNVVVDEHDHVDDAGWIFTASRFKTYTVEDIIAEHGPRIPDHSQAQKDFRAAAILLIDEDHPATKEVLETVSRNVSWFSHAGSDEFDQHNFYEATGGRGTITMDGLSSLKRRAGAKRLVPSSFGTPPPPIVDIRE